MGVLSKYKVILSGNILAGFERDNVLRGLAELFNSTPNKMEKLLGGTEIPLKKEYDRDQASHICQKVRRIGAECKVEEIVEDEISLEQDTLNMGRASSICPACQNVLDAPGAACQACGYAAGGMGSSSRYQGQAEMDLEQTEKSAKSEWQGKLQNLMDQYVQANTAYYKRQFARFGNPKKYKFALSWHWPAFFFFVLWALYRKMWLWAGAYLSIGLGLSLFIQPGLVYILWALVWPLTANYIYFRKVAAAVQNVSSGQAEIEYLKSAGGVSKAAVWCGIGLILLVSAMTSNYLTERFIKMYGEDIKEVLPGSGSQIRGDGSIIVDDTNGDSKLGITSLKLSYLGTSLKILLVKNENNESEQAISLFENQFFEKKIKDAWGQPVILVQEVDRYVLQSAGPDMQVDTDDDILQPVYYQ